MLSASLGPAPVDPATFAPPPGGTLPAVSFVAIDYAANTVTIVVWVDAPQSLQKPAFDSSRQPRNDSWENPVRALAGEPWRSERAFGTFDPNGHLVISSGGIPGIDGQVDYGVGGTTADSSRPIDKPAQALSSGPPAAPVTAPSGVVDLSILPIGHNATADIGNRMSRVVAAAANYFSSLAIPSTASPTTSTTFQTTLTKRVTTYTESGPDTLLVAVSGGSMHNDDLGDELDDSLNADGEPADRLAIDSALAADHIADSLDALERQRRAIDAVLAELHDIELPADNQATTKRGDEHDDRDPSDVPTAESVHVQTDEDAAPAEIVASTEPLAPAVPIDGGMVLIEAIGDANSSAYDLVAVYSQDVLREPAAPVGVEATVGIYQSIDVGTDRRIATTGEGRTAAIP